MKLLPFASIAALAFAHISVPAHAALRTFVSAAGGRLACTRAAPCATFQAAHDAADAGGAIYCIDAGNFAAAGATALTISKSITIDCGGAADAISGSTSNGVLINTPEVVVRLRNLLIETPN